MKLLKEYTTKSITIQYWINAEKQVALSILPLALINEVTEHRENLHKELAVKPLQELFKLNFPARKLDPLVHLHLRGDIEVGRLSAGTTMRNADAALAMHFDSQNELENEAGEKVIETYLKDERGLHITHRLVMPKTGVYLKISTEVKNGSDKSIIIDMLTSFSLSQISPFQEDDAVDTYYLHRYQSAWSAEGRHQEQAIEDINLERSWSGHGVRSLRFSQVGSMPVKGYFPYIAVEDRAKGVFWGARLSIPGSWQLELYRTDDTLNISGGQADREVGHWAKQLAVDESFCSSEVTVSTCAGSLEELNDNLLEAQASNNHYLPEIEKSLPIIFNEWCTSWGQPSEENMLKLVDTLKGSNVKYLVMDDGWFNEKASCQVGIGDWNIAEAIYPSGFKNLCSTIRKNGFIPGIWFEFESCTSGSKIFEQTEHLLNVDGHILQKGDRRFLDFRDPWVHDYLNKKVINQIKENGIGYIKIDYNDTIGLGCDGDVSLGEGLRSHLDGVQKFYRRLRQEIPELVIEVCSSGGHRLEPSFMALSSMGGFSDSHEGVDIPIIAANTAIQIQSRHNQIWAVLRKDDDEKRLYYSLSATFLGRMCLSGDIYTLSQRGLAIVKDAQELYVSCSQIIANGVNRRILNGVTSFVRPQGYQTVIRYAKNGKDALCVVHTFKNSPDSITVNLNGVWSVKQQFARSQVNVNCSGSQITLEKFEDFEGLVLQLEVKS